MFARAAYLSDHLGIARSLHCALLVDSGGRRPHLFDTKPPLDDAGPELVAVNGHNGTLQQNREKTAP